MVKIDYIFLLLYIFGILVIGGIFSTKMKNSSEMFTAGRHSSWWVAGLSGFMTVFSAGTFVVWGGIAYRQGIVAVSILMAIGFCLLLVGYFIAGRWRQMGITTPAEYLGLRFGNTTVQLYTLLGFVGRGIGMGVALYAMSIMLVVLVPLPEGNFLCDPQTGNLSVTWAILITGAIAVTYTMAGGLWAVLMTDVVQSIVLGLMIMIMVPLCLIKVGGLSGFITQAPEGFFSPASGKYSYEFLFLWFLIVFFQKSGDWPFIQRYICVPTVKDAKKVAYLMGVLFIVSPVIWMLPAMVYRILNPDANPEQAYILVSQDLLPAGMLGIMVAAMFSATASMIDSMLNVFAGVFTRDIYRTSINPGASERQLVIVGRIVTLAFGMLIIGLALLVPLVGGAERVVLTLVMLFIAPMTVPTIWGMFSRHIEQKAIWTTLGITYALGVIVRFGLSSELISSQGKGWASIAAFVQGNIVLIDGVLGLLVPLTILTVMELIAPWPKGASVGWQRLAQAIKEERGKIAVKAASKLPNKILAWTFGLLGLITGWLALVTNEQKIVLIVCAVMFLVISTGIVLQGRISKN